jgi:CubicO group peptidase (beta-lactamase class C family)
MRTLLAAGLAILAVMTAPGVTAQSAMSADAQSAIDSFLNMAVERGYVPGLGVAVVREGRVIYQRGVGMADRETGRRVDANTIFYIASCTKAFTALGTVLLDRAGVLELDATLAEILPDARLATGLDPRAITVRQLLTHTHGIAGNGPVSYRAAYSGEIERASMVRAIAAHQPAQNGTAYAYSNLGYNILSLGIDRLAKKPWQDVLAERVFRPLGLTSTSARVSEVPANRLAMPYRAEPEGMARLPYAKKDANMQAAGGIVSTTGDLARWITAVMDGGVIGGKRIFPAEIMTEVLKVQAKFSARSGGVERTGYALGWNYGTLDGQTIVEHGGGFPGFSASISFIPASRIGVIVLGNGAYSPQLQSVLTGYIYALLLTNKAALTQYQTQMNEIPDRVAQDRKAIAEDRARRASRPQTTALPLSGYAGQYVSESYGTIDVFLRDGRIHARNGVLESVAEVFDGQKNALRVELNPGTGGVLEFVAAGAKVTAVTYMGARFDRVK